MSWKIVFQLFIVQSCTLLFERLSFPFKRSRVKCFKNHWNLPVVQTCSFTIRTTHHKNSPVWTALKCNSLEVVHWNHQNPFKHLCRKSNVWTSLEHKWNGPLKKNIPSTWLVVRSNQRGMRIERHLLEHSCSNPIGTEIEHRSWEDNLLCKHEARLTSQFEPQPQKLTFTKIF